MLSTGLALLVAISAATGPAEPRRPPSPAAASAAADLGLADLRRMIGRPASVAAPDVIGTARFALACEAPGASAARSCRAVRTFGTTSIEPTFALAGHILIHDLQLVVSDGRVGGLSFRASADDYEALRMLLSKAYGAPRLSRSVIDTELGRRPQVKLTWSAGGQRLRVVDPAPPDLGILVTLSAARSG